MCFVVESVRVRNHLVKLCPKIMLSHDGNYCSSEIRGARTMLVISTPCLNLLYLCLLICTLPIAVYGMLDTMDDSVIKIVSFTVVAKVDIRK